MSGPIEPLSIGFIGYGKFSRFLHASLAELSSVQVKAIYDPLILGKRPLEIDNSITIAGSSEELLADPSIAAVHIVTPPATHAPLALAAIAAGKHVVVEKPLAFTAREAAEIISAASKAERVVAVNYVLRYNPLLDVFQRIIAQGLFGKLRWVRLENAVPQPPNRHWFWDVKQSGGIHLEHGVHFFDAALWLLADNAVDVSGSLVFREKKNTEAFADILFPNQCLVRFAHGFLTVPRVNTTTWLLVWDRATALIQGWTPTHATITAAANSAEVTTLREFGFSVSEKKDESIIQATREIATHEDIPYADAVRSLWGDVVASIRQGSHAVIPPHVDPAASIDLASRASRSSLRLTG